VENRKKRETSNTSFIKKHFSKLVIGIVIFGAILLGFIFPYPSQKNKTQVTTVSKEVLAHGETLYQSSCASCHGADGAGNMQNGIPALDGSMHSWHHDDDYLINQIRNGSLNMPAVGLNENWTDDDIEAVLIYFKQWWIKQQMKVQKGTIGE